jgi:hypothetical protein
MLVNIVNQMVDEQQSRGEILLAISKEPVWLELPEVDQLFILKYIELESDPRVATEQNSKNAILSTGEQWASLLNNSRELLMALLIMCTSLGYSWHDLLALSVSSFDLLYHSRSFLTFSFLRYSMHWLTNKT